MRKRIYCTLDECTVVIGLLAAVSVVHITRICDLCIQQQRLLHAQEQGCNPLHTGFVCCTVVSSMCSGKQPTNCARALTLIIGSSAVYV